MGPAPGREDRVRKTAMTQSGSTATEGIHRAIEWILRQALLHEHRQSHGTLPHVGHTAGQINPAARRQRDHQSSSALRTRRKARTSTAASTLTKTPLGSTISITPSARDRGGAGTGTAGGIASLPSSACSAGASSTCAKLGADPVTTLTWPPRACCRHEYSRPLLIAYLRATSVGVSSEFSSQPRSPASAPPSKYAVARAQEPPHAPALYPYDLSYGRPQHQRPQPQTTMSPWPPSITIRQQTATRRRHTGYV